MSVRQETSSNTPTTAPAFANKLEASRAYLQGKITVQTYLELIDPEAAQQDQAALMKRERERSQLLTRLKLRTTRRRLSR